MRYVSLFSGIEAASCAWKDIPGWEPVAFCEIDTFPSAVLAYHYPDVENLGDITEVDWKGFEEKHGAVDLVVGGSPCQSFSVAGGRAGLDGESGLMFEYLRAVHDLRPKWVLWENVPGVFSIDNGRAFGTLISQLQGFGYGVAWRVLDAQFFGLAQRRKRVFVVGCLGEVGSAAAVLFERTSVSGNTKTGAEQRETLTRQAKDRLGEAICIQGAGLTSQTSHGSGINEDVSFTLNCIDQHAVYAKQTRARTSDGYETWDDGEVSNTLNTFDVGDKRATELVVEQHSYSLNRQIIPENGTAEGPVENYEISPTLDAASQPHGVFTYSEPVEPIGFKYHQGPKARTIGDEEGISPTLTSDWHQPAVTEPVCMAPAFSKRPGQQIATTEEGVSYALTTGEPPRVTSD